MSDVEAQAALQAVVDSGQAEWYLSAGEKIEFTAIGFCAWYMAERQRIREQVAEEILADVAALFAARVGAGMWEAAYRAARVARGES